MKAAEKGLRQGQCHCQLGCYETGSICRDAYC